MKNFIMVIEPEAQEELAASGFIYTKTEINGKTVYAFAETDELCKYLSSNFEQKDWHCMKSNNLFF